MYDFAADELYIDSDLFSQFAGIDEIGKERIIDAMDAAGYAFDDSNSSDSRIFFDAENGDIIQFDDDDEEILWEKVENFLECIW